MTNLFDGPSGYIVAKIMAAQNADAEREAVELLAPSKNACVLVIGFGPGVGVEAILHGAPDASIIGVDPSQTMMREAGKRLRRHISAGRVALQRTTADKIAIANASVDGAIAVNSLQLCEPIADTARELARVLKSGAKLVSLTHDWAAERHAGSVQAWLSENCRAFSAAGFCNLTSSRANAERGRSLLFSVTRK